MSVSSLMQHLNMPGERSAWPSHYARAPLSLEPLHILPRCDTVGFEDTEVGEDGGRGVR